MHITRIGSLGLTEFYMRVARIVIHLRFGVIIGGGGKDLIVQSQRAGIVTEGGSSFRNLDLQILSIVEAWSGKRSVVGVLRAAIISRLIESVPSIFLHISVQHPRDARHVRAVGVSSLLILLQSVIVLAHQEVSPGGIG